MKIKTYLLGLFTLITSASFAQDSSATYSHHIQDAFISGGFILGPSAETGKVLYGQSREFMVGLGTGYRFAKWNGIGVDIYYKSTDFFLKQDSNKILPNNIQHNSEKISFNNFGGLVFDRFYFGKMYLDGGFYFDWAFYSKHITWDKDTTSNGGSTIKGIDKQLKFINPTNYGLTFRFGGMQGISFYFNYRLSKVFKPDFNYPELPPFVLGIIIGTH